MKEINSGKYEFQGQTMNCGRVAAGIRGSVQQFIDGGEIPDEVIMTALLGEDGCYRRVEDLKEILKLYPSLASVGIKKIDDSDFDVPANVVVSLKVHRGHWKSLLDYVDIVYPDPVVEKEETALVEETPFD